MIQNLVVFLLFTILPFFANGALLGLDYGSAHLKSMLVAPSSPLELVLTAQSKRKDINGIFLHHYTSYVERIYGSEIGSLSTRFPQNSVLNLKYLLNSDNVINENSSFYNLLHPGLNLTLNDRNVLDFTVENETYSIEELIGMQFQQQISHASKLLSSSSVIDYLAVTIPEYFNQNERLSLLDSISITPSQPNAVLISDSNSIGINFALKNNENFEPGKNFNYIIYDMGSSSTKVSILNFYQDLNTSIPLKIELIGYDNSNVGGDLLNKYVTDLIIKKIIEVDPKFSIDTLSNRNLARIVTASEKAKTILSANNDARISIENIINNGNDDFHSTVLRGDFENLFNETAIIEPIHNALNNLFSDNITLSLKDIDGIILAGGSTRVPFIQKQLIKLVGSNDKILKNINADESAVNGVTIRGIKAFNAFKTKPVTLVDRSIFDYSISTSDSLDLNSTTVFPRGSSYPNSTSLLVNITDFKSNNIINLYENGQFINSVSFNGKSIQKSFKKCKSSYFNLTFSLSKSRIFSVSINGVCDSTSNSISTTISNSSVTHLTLKQKLNLREKINILDKLDDERLAFQKSLNVLESRLYELRNFVIDEETLNNGPKSQVKELSTLVEKYLEWLELEADDANHDQVLKITSQVDELHRNIEFYIKSANEPLDVQQFRTILNDCGKIIEEIKSIDIGSFEALATYDDQYVEVMGTTPHDLFNSIKLPRYLQKELITWNDTIANFKDEVTNLEKLVKKALKGMSREDLFDFKTKIDQYLTELKEKFAFYSRSVDYKINEVQGAYRRKLRAIKRKEERELRKQNGTNSSNSENASKIKSTSSEKFSTATISSSTSSTIPTTSTSTSSSLEQDEL